VNSHPNLVLLLGGPRAREARTEKQRARVVETIVYRLYGKMKQGRYGQHVLPDGMQMQRFRRFVDFEFDPGVAEIVAGLEASSLKSNRKSSKSK
jgi:hypothetical protein